MFLWRHDSNLTYREGQGDLLVTKCFKVSQTLQARCVFDQFLLESTTCTMKCKRISSLKCLTLQEKLTRRIGHVHQHTHVFLGTSSRLSSSILVRCQLRTHISCEPKTEIFRPHIYIFNTCVASRYRGDASSKGHYVRHCPSIFRCGCCHQCGVWANAVWEVST